MDQIDALNDFLDEQLECVTKLIPVIECGLRHPFAQAANHLLETLDNTYGDTPGLRLRINELRAKVVEACALKPKPQPLPLWIRQGRAYPPHLPSSSSRPDQPDLRNLRFRRQGPESK